MTSPRFSTAELQEHSSSISKSSRAARVAAAAARGAGKGMTSAERSAAAKKGWETRRRNGGGSGSGQMTQAKMDHVRSIKASEMVAGSGAKKRPSTEQLKRGLNTRSRRKAALRSSLAAQEARKRRGSGAPASKKSALSAKDQSLPYTLKVKKLRTIGVRAQAKADWLSGRKGKDGKQLPAEFVDRAEAAKYQAKAKAVADELLALARENNDPRADRFK